MEAYVTIVRELDDKASEANRKFEECLDASANFRSRTRAMNLAKAAMTFLNETTKHVNVAPRTPYAVRNWWEVFVQERYPQEQCLEYLRCSRKTYIHLVKSLRPHIKPRVGAVSQRQRSDTLRGVSVEKQVALMLHKLVQSNDYAIVSGMFGIHKSTVHKILYKAIKGVNKHLLQTVIKMPTRHEACKIARQLQTLSRIPQLIGSLESTHIPIFMSGQSAFTNSKNYPSFILQTVVDANCWLTIASLCTSSLVPDDNAFGILGATFRDVSVRHPGSADDRRVLEDSSIYKLHDRVIPSDTRKVNGLEVPYKIAASFTYPSLPWLLPEFEPAVTQSELTFNEHLRIVRYCSAAALARLKARFAILRQAIDVSYKIAPQIIATCCAIHNICENNQDPFADEWLQESLQNCDKFPQPERTRDRRVPDPRDLQLRDTLRDYLQTQLLLDSTTFVCIDHRKNNALT